MLTGRQALALVTISFSALINSAGVAEIAVSANDGKMVLENGVTMVRKEPLPDTISIIEMSGASPRIIAELPVPASVVGPPPSVAIAPDESFALVTGAMKVDPADPTKTVRRRQTDRHRPEILAAKGDRDVAGGARRRRCFDQPCSDAGAGCQPQRRHRLGLYDQRQHVDAVGQDCAGRRQVRPEPCDFLPRRRDRAGHARRRQQDLVLAVDGDKVEYTKRDLSRRLASVSDRYSPAAATSPWSAMSAPAAAMAIPISLIDMRAKPIRVATTSRRTDARGPENVAGRQPMSP